MGKRIKLSNSSLNRQVDGGKTLAQAAHGSPGRLVFQSHIYHISHHTSLFFKFLARCLLYCSRCFFIVCSLIQSYSISNFVSFDHIRVTQFLEQISVFHTTVDDCIHWFHHSTCRFSTIGRSLGSSAIGSRRAGSNFSSTFTSSMATAMNSCSRHYSTLLPP